MRVSCPKCSSVNALLVPRNDDIVLECGCGFNKTIFTSLQDSVSIEHKEIEENVTLPKPGSKLRECLSALVNLRTATTKEITEEVMLFSKHQWTTGEVASFLTILRYRGLVEPLTAKRGIAGGSKWRPTKTTETLLQ